MKYFYCYDCKDGFKMNDKDHGCQTCGEGCQLCNKRDGCTACLDTHNLLNNTCTPKIDKCIIANASQPAGLQAITKIVDEDWDEDGEDDEIIIDYLCPECVGTYYVNA